MEILRRFGGDKFDASALLVPPVKPDQKQINAQKEEFKTKFRTSKTDSNSKGVRNRKVRPKKNKINTVRITENRNNADRVRQSQNEPLTQKEPTNVGKSMDKGEKSSDIGK